MDLFCETETPRSVAAFIAPMLRLRSSTTPSSKTKLQTMAVAFTVWRLHLLLLQIWSRGTVRFSEALESRVLIQRQKFDGTESLPILREEVRPSQLQGEFHCLEDNHLKSTTI